MSASPEASPEAALDRASVLPASLAALAEAGVIFLPLQEMVRELTGAAHGPLLAWQVFLPLFVAGVGLATYRRGSRRASAVAAAVAIVVGVVQATGWGSRSPLAGATVVVLALAVALRAMVLANRDWRDPIRTSFIGGALALLLEIMIVSPGVAQPWPRLVGPITVVFFVASLASRAASVRIEAGRPRTTLAEELRRDGSVARTGIVPLCAVAIAVAVVAVTAGDGGALHVAGGVVAAGLGSILIAIAWVFAPLVSVVEWLAHLIHLNLSGLFDHILRPLQSGGAAGHHGPTSVLERSLEVASLLLVGALLVWLIRRRRRPTWRSRARRAASEAHALGSVVSPAMPGERRFRLRRELPEVTVRRWYAEALLLLERRDLPKPDHITPAEFVPSVGRAFPTVRSSFERLTHAYEDVRYGDRDITSERLARLKEARPMMMDVLRAGERADVDDRPSVAEEPGPWASA